MKLPKRSLYYLLMIGWGYFWLHYWRWIMVNTQVDWRYMIVETWMLLSFMVFTAIAILAVREEQRE